MRAWDLAPFWRKRVDNTASAKKQSNQGSNMPLPLPPSSHPLAPCVVSPPFPPRIRSQATYIAFSRDVTAAILVFQNNETAAMLVYQENPLGVVLFFYVYAFLCYNKLA